MISIHKLIYLWIRKLKMGCLRLMKRMKLRKIKLKIKLKIIIILMKIFIWMIIQMTTKILIKSNNNNKKNNKLIRIKISNKMTKFKVKNNSLKNLNQRIFLHQENHFEKWIFKKKQIKKMKN